MKNLLFILLAATVYIAPASAKPSDTCIVNSINFFNSKSSVCVRELCKDDPDLYIIMNSCDLDERPEIAGCAKGISDLDVRMSLKRLRREARRRGLPVRLRHQCPPRQW